MYLGQISNILNGMINTVDAAKQVADLQKLIELQNKVEQVCNKYCDSTGEKQIKNYLENLNNSIASQFDQARATLHGAQTTIKNLQDIINFFQSGVGVVFNTKQAALALQKSILKVQAQMQITLAQLNALFSQQAQKQLAEQKLERSVNRDIYSGFSKSGL